MAENNKDQYDVAVIGGGPGGYAAAFKSADLGLRTALIDPGKNPGGVCLYRGCIPSKALLHLVKLKKDAEDAKNFGLDFGKPKIDLKKIRGWKDDVVTSLTSGLGQLTKIRKIDHIQGYGKFVDDHTLSVSGKEKRQIRFKNAIIATGSEPVSLPGVDAGSGRIIFAEQALNLEEIPGSLLVIGGGYIGLEMGTVYKHLGSKVTIAEMTSGYMPGADPDLVKVFAKHNDGFFDSVKFNVKVTELKETKSGIKATFEHKEKKKETASFDKVLIAIGRKPIVAGLNLEKVKVKTDKKGFILVDPQRKTSAGHIYAIGDVAGEPLLAHKATHEGQIAAEAIAGKNSVFEPKTIPAVVYTDPEIAWCGLTESEAKERGMDVKISKFPWTASGRAKTIGRSDGLTKMVLDKKTERVLGVGIAGTQAGDLISEGVLAVEMAAVAADLSLTIHPHPTLSETVMEAAELFYGSSTHIYRK